VAAKVTPVQAQSDNNNLIFFSQYGSGVTLLPNKQQIVFNSVAGTLTESTTAADAGSVPPSFSFANNTPTNFTILTKATQASVTGVTQPVFQYYAYSGAGISTTPLPVPLSVTDAQSVADVDISFAAGPSTPGGTQADRTVNQYSRVVLRLSPPSGTATVNAPCA
jgi:hypothetical protein